MDPGVVGVFIPIIIAGGAMGLVALRMTLAHLKDSREHQHLSGGAQQEVARLTDAVEGLSAEVELLRSDYSGLNERLDFTERLLESPALAAKPPGGAARSAPEEGTGAAPQPPSPSD